MEQEKAGVQREAPVLVVCGVCVVAGSVETGVLTVGTGAPGYDVEGRAVYGVDAAGPAAVLPYS